MTLHIYEVQTSTRGTYKLIASVQKRHWRRTEQKVGELEHITTKHFTTLNKERSIHARKSNALYNYLNPTSEEKTIEKVMTDMTRLKMRAEEGETNYNLTSAGQDPDIILAINKYAILTLDAYIATVEPTSMKPEHFLLLTLPEERAPFTGERIMPRFGRSKTREFLTHYTTGHSGSYGKDLTTVKVKIEYAGTLEITKGALINKDVQSWMDVRLRDKVITLEK